MPTPKHPVGASGTASRRRNEQPEATREDQPLVDRAITRAVSGHRQVAAADIDRIIEAAYRVVERQGTVDPKLRDILDEAGLSTEAFYRHFHSKDELMLVLLGDGRHRLAGYLAHRMEKADGPLGRVQAWIEGVLAQAVDPKAASRTRPFLANLSRLTEQFPTEQQLSVRALVELLEESLQRAAADGEAATDDPTRDARAVYQLVISVMETHVLAGTRPEPADIEHLVRFAFRAILARHPGSRS